MITSEGIKLLNSLLYDFPVDRMFSISDYTENKNDGHKFDNEITSFLIKENFADFIRSDVLSRHQEKREILLTAKGIELKNAGSYDIYSNRESVKIIKEEARIDNQQTNLLWLTSILAFGTLALAGSEFVKIYYEHPLQLCTYVKILIGLAVLVLILTSLRMNRAK